MAAATDTRPRLLLSDRPEDLLASRTLPILTPTIKMSAPSPGDPMEVTTPTNSSAPASATKSPVREQSEGDDRSKTPIHEQTPSSGNGNATMAAPAAAAAAVHQPKIVQTAFIHKLYNMLEDENIQHLISWTSSQESFVMQPSNDFSKVLAQYFKHTNISSFVRQLNMYGFHKVSDVFHHGTSETALWEFKHGNGNFKRGDIVGLREIKRRASRHALVHREYSSQKATISQPGTPAEPMPVMQEGGDPRLNSIEHTLFDVASRLQRSEEAQHYMHIKYQTVVDTVSRLLQFNQKLSETVLALVPSHENPIHREVVALQGEMQRQAEIMRTLEEPHEPLTSSRQYFSNLENAPVSPRQLPQDDGRRATLAVPQSRSSNYYRPPIPSNLSLATRRPYGSIGASTATSQSSPSPFRAQAPPPPPGPHPAAAMAEPPSGSLARRHTSADIRAHGWQPTPSPFGASGPASSQWPSSPSRAGGAPEDQRIRDSLSQYSLQNASRPHSRPTTPPPPAAANPFINGGAAESFGGWSWGAATQRGENKNLALKDGSGPPTRRGSMAHILNPTETAERDDEDEDDPRGDDDRKRKRMT